MSGGVVTELFASLGLIPDEKSWERGHELIEKLHTALNVYLGYEGIEKVKSLIEGTVEAAVHAKHLGERLGVTGEAVQELGYAAEQTGSSAGQLQTALQRLSLGLQMVKKTGTGPLAEAMRELRIPIANLQKEKLDQNLEEIAEAFSKAGPQVNKTGLAMEIFGRSGAQLIPLLNKGKAGIVDLREEAQRLGLVMGEEAQEKAEEFEVAQKKVAAALKGLRNEAVVAMLPALKEMTEGLSEWIAENREAIASGLAAALHGLVTAFQMVGHAIYTVIQFFKEHDDAVVVLVAALGIYAAVAIKAAIASALAWAAAAAPFVLIGAAIAALVIGIKHLVEYLTGRALTLEEMWDGLVDGGEAALDWLEALPGRALTWIEDVAKSIKDAFTDAWDWAVKKAHEAWEDIKGIPVIGHIIKGGAWAADKIGDALSFDMGGVMSKVKAENGVIPGGGPMTTDANGIASITVGDLTFHIDAKGMTPEELQAAMKAEVVAGITDAVRQARSNTSGGKR